MAASTIDPAGRNHLPSGESAARHHVDLSSRRVKDAGESLLWSKVGDGSSFTGKPWEVPSIASGRGLEAAVAGALPGAAATILMPGPEDAYGAAVVGLRGARPAGELLDELHLPTRKVVRGADDALDAAPITSRGAPRSSAAQAAGLEKGFTAAETAGPKALFGQGSKGARSLIDRLAAGERVALAEAVTTDTLRTYRGVAERAILKAKGTDFEAVTTEVQSARMEAIDKLLEGR